jgi:hypothetical protein
VEVTLSADYADYTDSKIKMRGSQTVKQKGFDQTAEALIVAGLSV